LQCREILRPIAFSNLLAPQTDILDIHMPEPTTACDIPDDLIRLKQRLPRLVEALNYRRKIKIVAIGSSSTAGEGDVVPYPSRLELALRNRFPDRMIDVVNRGIGGQEAPSELARFETDVFAEEPVLVIWQVGTNAIFYRDQYDPATVVRSVATGLNRLKRLTADVILMDLQYAPDLLIPTKIADTKLIVSLIAGAADTAGVSLFPRFALMQRWREVDKIPPEKLIAADGLHQTDWSTNCVAKALFRAIEQAVTPEVLV
jgi:hypothetical protein